MDLDTNEIYDPKEVILFWKTKERFGGLSNMAAGFPLRINGIEIPTAEALYQACRFPDYPDLQREIISQRSPIAAKAKSRSNKAKTRPDWENVKVEIMRWCLRVKLVQHWDRFASLLLETEDKPIVEYSRRDDFWGAKELSDGRLKGRNVLGKLLMELREEVKLRGKEAFQVVEPPSIPKFLLMGEPVGPIQIEEAHPGSGQQPFLFPDPHS